MTARRFNGMNRHERRTELAKLRKRRRYVLKWGTKGADKRPE